MCKRTETGQIFTIPRRAANWPDSRIDSIAGVKAKLSLQKVGDSILTVAEGSDSSALGRGTEGDLGRQLRGRSPQLPPEKPWRDF